MNISKKSFLTLGLLVGLGALGSCSRDQVTAPEPSDARAGLSTAATTAQSLSEAFENPGPVRAARGAAVTANNQILASTVFPTRAAFNAANTGLPVEDFQDTNVPPGFICAFIGAMNSSTNNGCVSPGQILPGLSLRSSGADQMVVLGDGTFGVQTADVGPNFFADFLTMTFAGNPCAVGFDLDASTTFGSNSVSIDVFDAGNNLIGTFVRTTSVGGTFFGISSTTGISRIVVTGTSGFGLELVDDIAFGCGGLVGPGSCQGEATSPGVTSFSFSGVTTFIGTDHPDVIGGTNGIDVILGKGEEDLLCGWGGIDTIDGGGGDDEMYGGNQDDFLFGKQGADYLDGENAQNRLDGGHTPVPSSSADQAPDTCVKRRSDRLYLCEIVIDAGSGGPSSALFKDHVVELLPEGVTLFGVRPVAFRYVEPYGDPSVPQFGFIAEEVAQVYPEAIIRQDGRIWGIAYPQLNTMLVEEAGKRASKTINDGAARLLEAAF